ncbi:MAG: AmmeMemoRadiSam system protein A [Candidatus Hydrogenedentes bacterium]|nr:AmmeMemoRadiSam system protein A [Candidatus Hydrogenedentota bacterium]
MGSGGGGIMNLDTKENYLTDEEEVSLLLVARDTLEYWVRRGQRVGVERYALTPKLWEKHGAFVTLKKAGELRGCIGYTANREPLVIAVQDNAINAASRDPRFSSVTPDELDDITIEISAMTSGDDPDTPFRQVHDIQEIIIGRDGLFIETPPLRGGLLLPQVAVEEDWNVQQFLSALCRKAGYPDGAWRDTERTRLYRFSAQVFREVQRRDLAINPDD